MDDDGDIDIFSASYVDGKISWYENDGIGNFTTHNISILSSATSVAAADLDGDGDIDVFASGGSQISW